MNTEIELLKDIAARLTSAGFAYMVTGAMALALYGVPRMTRDIDIVIHLADSDADKIATLFEEEYCLEPEGIRKAIARRQMFNIIHYEQVFKIDFVVRKDEPYRIKEFERRREFRVEEQTVYVVAPEDLVLSKLLWARDSDSEVQRRDIQQLLANPAVALDYEYLDAWACTLGVATLLREVANNA